MNRYDQSHPWGVHSPLMSLSGLALIAAASSRLSYSLQAWLLLFCVYGFTLPIIKWGKPIIPEKYKTAITIMTVTFAASLFYLFMSMINPVSALELNFIVFLVPVTFLGSRIVERTDHLPPEEGVIRGLKEVLTLGGIIAAVSIIREPLGYGTLSFPFASSTVNILSDAIQERAVLQVFAAPAGGFILTACLIALVRLVFYRHGSSMLEKEDFDD